MSRKILAWLSLSWAGLLLIFSFLPTLPHLGPAGMDKFYHLFAYLILGVLAQSAWGFRSLLFGCALGIVTELGQGFIPKRSAEPLDLLVNLLGLLMGTFGAYWFGRLR